MKTAFKNRSILLHTSISKKLLIAPAILILALLLVSGLAIHGLNVQASLMKKVNEVTQNQIALIDKFALQSEQVQSDVYQIAVLRFMEMSEEEIQPVQSRLEQGVNELKIIYGEISTTWQLDPTEQAILESMKDPMNDFTLQAQQATEVLTKNPSFGVLMVRSSTVSYSKFRNMLAEFLQYKNENIARTQLVFNQRINTLKIVLTTSLLIMAALGLHTNILISTRFIALPIKKITDQMISLAKNDLSVELDGLERKDEIGSMARAVEIFRNNAIEKDWLDKELQESQDRLLMAQEVAHIGNWELDLASNILWASVEAFKIYGLDRSSPYLALAEIQKLPMIEDRPHLDDALNALIEKEAPYNEEFRILQPNEKSPRMIHSRANLVRDESGTPIKVIGVIQDITERVQAETSLRQSEEKFSRAFHTANYAITITRVDNGKFIDVNEAFTSMTGVSREEALSSSSIALKLWVNDEDRQSVMAALQAGQMVEGREFLFRTKNDGIIIGLFSAQIIQLSYGPCVLSSINDITKRKHAEEQLQIFSAKLERSNKELEQFAYIASHDLQEPLRMVTSYLRLIEKRYKDSLDEDMHEFIGYAVDGAHRMKSLITALLNMSRVSTHGKAFAMTECESVLEKVIQNLEIVIEESKAQISHDPLPNLVVDSSQFEQLFQNLIGNAIKFHGDEAPKVHISAKIDDQNWIFSVRDNGIGIDPKFHDRVFIIFQRLHNRDQYEGTGIGLAISQRIVERHGGRIWIESEPGKGSIFYFSIPNKGE